MPYITRFPGPDSTIEDWRQFAEEAGAQATFDFIRATRRVSGKEDLGFLILVETAQEMVADAGGGTPTTGLSDEVIAQVADDLGYSPTTRTNFRKLVLGQRRPRIR